MKELTRLEKATLNLAAAHKALADYQNTDPAKLAQDIADCDAELKAAAVERAKDDERHRVMMDKAAQVDAMEEREANALAEQNGSMADELEKATDTAPATAETTDPAVADDGHGGDDGADYATDGVASEGMLAEMDAAEDVDFDDLEEDDPDPMGTADAQIERDNQESAEAVAQFSEDTDEAEGDDGAGLVADSEAAVAQTVDAGEYPYSKEPAVEEAADPVEDDSDVIDAIGEVSEEEAVQAAQ